MYTPRPAPCTLRKTSHMKQIDAPFAISMMLIGILSLNVLTTSPQSLVHTFTGRIKFIDVFCPHGGAKTQSNSSHVPRRNSSHYENMKLKCL